MSYDEFRKYLLTVGNDRIIKVIKKLNLNFLKIINFILLKIDMGYVINTYYLRKEKDYLFFYIYI
jgi:hypothetical protein